MKRLSIVLATLLGPFVLASTSTSTADCVASTGEIERVLDLATHTLVAPARHRSNNSGPSRTDVQFSLPAVDAAKWRGCLLRVRLVLPECVTIETYQTYKPADAQTTTDTGFVSGTSFDWTLDVDFAHRGNNDECSLQNPGYAESGWFVVSVKGSGDNLRALNENGSLRRRYPIRFTVHRL